MKRRMSAADRVALEAEARPIVSLYMHRAADVGAGRRSAQSMMQLVQEILRRGCMVRFSPADGVRLSPVQQWLVAVEWIWQIVDQELGAAARHIVIFRLTRPAKTEASSFGRIAADITAAAAAAGRNDIVVTLEDAEEIYRASLQRFVALLHERGITRAVSESNATHSSYRPWTDPRSQHRLIAMGRQLQRLATRRRRRTVRVVQVQTSARATVQK